jgi:hypothetical protein
MLHGSLAELRTAEGEQREHLSKTIERLFLRHSSRPSTDAKR